MNWKQRALKRSTRSACDSVANFRVFVSSWLTTTSALADFALPAARPWLPPLLVLRHRSAPPRAVFARAHALENLYQPQVDLPQVHVHADDLHLHLVAAPRAARGARRGPDSAGSAT